MDDDVLELTISMHNNYHALRRFALNFRLPKEYKLDQSSIQKHRIRRKLLLIYPNCPDCGKSFEKVQPTIEHVIPAIFRSSIGANSELLCRSCNMGRMYEPYEIRKGRIEQMFGVGILEQL